MGAGHFLPRSLLTSFYLQRFIFVTELKIVLSFFLPFILFYTRNRPRVSKQSSLKSNRLQCATRIEEKEGGEKKMRSFVKIVSLVSEMSRCVISDGNPSPADARDGWELGEE